ncbi:histidine kinase [Sphaerisporangium sp. B11E5]|uniref:sensor histidine kinase n=1 Tax=Sphaerisporangium sp. B11E5 TaxID=3153563 RepID=UPI00325EA754
MKISLYDVSRGLAATLTRSPQIAWHYTEFLVGAVIGALIVIGVFLVKRRINGRVTESADAFEERRRIARELHDGLGHGLLLITMHARRLPKLAPETKVVAKTIEETASDILGQVRTAIGVLRRSGPGHAPGPSAPLSAHVAALISNLPSDAPTVRLALRGAEHRLDERVSHVALRLVQEGLTNAVKYGGGGLPVRVALDFGAELEVSVSTGDGALVEHTPALAGFGLLGMREGVISEGGRFECGPLSDGGFLVRAWLPAKGRIREACTCGDR